MIQASNIPVTLDALLPENDGLFRREVAHALGVKAASIEELRLLKRSIDARKKSNVHGVVTVTVRLARGAKPHPVKGVATKPYEPTEPLRIPWVGPMARCHQPAPSASSPCHPERAAAGAGPKDSEAPGRLLRPVVVGTGPAGLFCALYLARAGLRPLVVERGAAVDERLEIVEAFNAGAPLDTRTNIQFGEGGAGTFSDGKLNTGIKSPHIRHVLEAFVEAGAPEDILVDAKPHIGTDLLVGVVRNLRYAIEEAGGEVRFLTRLDGLGVAEGHAGAAGGSGYAAGEDLRAGVRNGEDPDGASSPISPRPHVTAAVLVDERTGATEVVPADCVVLACGHSARDTFAMVRDAGVAMERKPFAVGVRIEHPQQQVNAMQYGVAASHPALGAADYKLAVKCADGRGVYTFCMCPGGEVVAAASEEGALCVNGMSRHARAGTNANSALLVEVRPDDLPGDDPLEGITFQRQLERSAYQLGRGAWASYSGEVDEGAPAAGAPIDSRAPYTAPAQTVGDFLKGASGTPSDAVGPSYPRGVAWCDLRQCLPPFVADSLVEAFPLLDRKLHGFADPQAVMTAVEARSSSPVRLVRDGSFQSSIAGLYPCGEGAGYAGGITSAAVDGLRVAEAIVAELTAHGEKKSESGSGRGSGSDLGASTATAEKGEDGSGSGSGNSNSKSNSSGGAPSVLLNASAAAAAEGGAR